jgi:hypothetical protein
MDAALLDTVISISTTLRPIIIAFVLYGVWRGTHLAGLPDAERTRMPLAIGAAIVVWLFVADVLARADVYAPGAGLGPFPIAVAVPVAIGVGYVLLSRRVAAVLDAMPLSWLVGLQVYRLLGFVFLVQLARGLAPAVFAIPAGLGDVLTGVFALPVAMAVAREQPGAERSAVLWNVFGILDFVVAMTIGVLSTEGPLQMLAFEHPNRLTYPLVLIPTFAVPLSLILHAASLRQIGRPHRAHAAGNRLAGLRRRRREDQTIGLTPLARE